MLLSKPGALSLNRRKAPRGLIFCSPLASTDFRDLTGNFSLPVATSITPVALGIDGLGLTTSSTACLGYAYGKQPPQTWSMEVIERSLNPTVGGSLCGWNQGSDGTNGTFDRTMYSGATGWRAYLFDGAQKIAGDVGGWTANTRNHLIATCDAGAGSGTLTLYCFSGNTVTSASLAVSNGGYTGYTTTYFCIGNSNNPSATSGFQTTAIELVNFAAVCWSAGEVTARFNDPWGFLRPARRTYYFAVVGGATTLSLAAAALNWTPLALKANVALGEAAPGLAWTPKAEGTNLALPEAKTALGWTAQALTINAKTAMAVAKVALGWTAAAFTLPVTLGIAKVAWALTALAIPLVGVSGNTTLDMAAAALAWTALAAKENVTLAAARARYGLKGFTAIVRKVGSIGWTRNSAYLPPVPADVSPDQDRIWRQQAASRINALIGGKSNATGTLTLNASQTSTILIDPRISTTSHIAVQPATASAATAGASTSFYIVTSHGYATVHHASNAATDQTFSVLIIG